MVRDYLIENYNNRFQTLIESSNLPDGYMVYILTFNDNAIVVGKGKKNRAIVIFPETNVAHYKSLLVRLYWIYHNEEKDVFVRYIIPCQDDKQAREIEKHLHNNIGGTGTALPEFIEQNLFENLNNEAKLILKLALVSSYDGLSDLKKWHKERLLSDEIWNQLCQKLRLNG